MFDNIGSSLVAFFILTLGLQQTNSFLRQGEFEIVSNAERTDPQDTFNMIRLMGLGLVRVDPTERQLEKKEDKEGALSRIRLRGFGLVGLWRFPKSEKPWNRYF